MVIKKLTWFERLKNRKVIAFNKKYFLNWNLFPIDVFFSVDKNIRNVCVCVCVCACVCVRVCVRALERVCVFVHPFRHKKALTHTHTHTHTHTLKETLIHTHTLIKTHIWQRASDFMDLMVDWIDVHNLEGSIEMIEKGMKNHKEELEKGFFLLTSHTHITIKKVECRNKDHT